jgi:hypothetical protein
MFDDYRAGRRENLIAFLDSAQPPPLAPGSQVVAVEPVEVEPEGMEQDEDATEEDEEDDDGEGTWTAVPRRR